LKDACSQLKRATFDMIKSHFGAIEAKDPFTKGHPYRVSQISLEIGKKIGISERALEVLECGCLLHDIGKIGIKESVLRKPGPLSVKEYAHIQRHVIIGEEIVKPVEIFRPILPMVRNHHERFDGGGYPDGLKGEDINIFARIIAISDSFDAMTSDRFYRKALSVKDALLKIEDASGTHFDSRIVHVFIKYKIYERTNLTVRPFKYRR
jgi:HD-GYP domain-containing protein (c-di-GMP phosphodiesterase class II)